MSGTIKMTDENVCGDIVLMEGHSLEARIINHFTPQPLHAAVRTGINTAEGLQVYGMLKHDLSSPQEEYTRYLILEHTQMTPIKRMTLERLHKELSTDYDILLIFELALKKFMGHEPDIRDMSHKDKYTCDSRIAAMYEGIGIYINHDIHSSQIESHHFLENPEFKVIYEWKR